MKRDNELKARGVVLDTREGTIMLTKEKWTCELHFEGQGDLGAEMGLDGAGDDSKWY